MKYFLSGIQTWKKFVSFRDPSLEFIIISAKYPTKNQQFRHFTQIDDWFLLQNCQNTLYFIILSTKEVLFLLKTSILLQLWKKFPQLYRNFRDPGSRGSRVFPCLRPYTASYTVLASRVSGSESRSNKDDLGKVSREKIFIFLAPCWCQEREQK